MNGIMLSGVAFSANYPEVKSSRRSKGIRATNRRGCLKPAV